VNLIGQTPETLKECDAYKRRQRARHTARIIRARSPQKARDRIVIAGSKEYRPKNAAGPTRSIFRGFLRVSPGMPVA
jgi:hypothetical protein